MAIALEVWGDWALFTRPELKTERVSYDVMTPSAARGILESIFWHPGLKFRIDRIRVFSALEEMHQLYNRGYTPKVKPRKGCSACSLNEICLPKLHKATSVSTYLSTHLEESL